MGDVIIAKNCIDSDVIMRKNTKLRQKVEKRQQKNYINKGILKMIIMSCVCGNKGLRLCLRFTSERVLTAGSNLYENTLDV